MSTLRITVALTFAALALSVATASAQFGFPSPDQPDMTIDAATRAQVIDSLAAQLDGKYVFPESGKAMARALKARQKHGDYDRITSAKEFADSLTAHVRAVVHDLHLHALYSQKEFDRSDPADHQPSPEERARLLEQSRLRNFGFEKVRRLPGNVGYMELTAFDSNPSAGAIATAAMTLLANSDALIIDLRRNGGGDPMMIDLILSYLMKDDQRVHVNDFYQREGNLTEEYWTYTNLPGPRYGDKEVFVLTSRFTGSAAEEFAYDIKNLKRGTVVGEITAGAANPGELVRVHPHFACFIPTGRAISPVTHTNWEGVGVAPDVATSADEALKTAHQAALGRLIEHSQDPDRKTILARALEQVKNTPAEPLDLPKPPARASAAAAPGGGH